MSGFSPEFDAAGSGTRDGSVPAPGAIDGRTFYLRADRTWAVPAGNTPGPQPPPPGPDLNQWACNIAGYLTYEVARIAVKLAVDWVPVSWIGDIVGGIAAGVIRLVLAEDPIIAAIISDMVFHFVSDHIVGLASDALTALLDDVLWAKVHCALYSALADSPTDFLAALTAAAGVIGAFLGYPAPATAAIAYFLQHLGITDVANIPITAFIQNYNCSTCAITGIGPQKPLLQSSFDLTVTDGTTADTFVDSVQFALATVSGTSPNAVITPNAATASTQGVIQPDGVTCYVDSSGILHTSGGLTATVNVLSAPGSGKVSNLGAGGTPPAGWQAAGYADGGWAASVSSSQTSPVIGGSAWLTWQDGDLVDNDVWLYRLHFTPPAGALVQASLHTKFDNWSTGAYINGTQVLAAQSPTTGISGPTTTAFPPGLITPGSSNVLAIAVQNTSGVGHPNGSALDFLLALTYTAAVTVEHNGAAVAAESAIDFEDSANITWTVADDPSNARVSVSGAVGSASALLTGYGVLSSRPAFGHAGALYYATDTHLLYRDSGTAWATLSFDASVLASGQVATARGGLGVDSSGYVLGTVLANSGGGWLGDAPTADGAVLTSDSAQPGGVSWKTGTAGGTGGLIALTAYRPVAETVYTITNTGMAAVDSTNLSITFTAPVSRNVLVRLTGVWRGASTGQTLYVGLLESGVTVCTGIASDVAAVHNGCVSFYLSSIAAGAHTYKWGVYMQGASSGFMVAGPTNGQLIMEVWAI